MSKSLQARMTYLLAAFVLLVVVSVAAMMWGSETQRQDALLINLAGRQRMLAQQMARLALEADGVVVDGALPEAERLFDQTQAALREGGVAPYPSGVPVTLPAAQDAELRAALDQVDLAWGGFRALLDKQQPELAGDYPSPAARQAVAASAAVLLERADQVVRLYEDNAVAKVNRLHAMQIGFLLGALVLLAVGAWQTRRAVLLPLQELAQATRRLGNNDLDSAVHVTGPQEVQDLAQAFDAMRLSLRGSRAEQLELAATLETRVDRRTRELNALNEVSREIASQLELRALLSSVADKARVLLDADLAMLCLLDDSRQRLQLQAASGEHAAQTGAVHASTDIALARGVLLSQHALMCSDAHCVSGCAMLANDHTASHVVAPLRIGEHVIGALCVTSAQPQHFPAESTELATKLANIAAVALQNARLYAQAEKVAALEERNRIAADMHDGLAQTLSYLGLVTDETAELLAEGEQPRALANLERTRATLNQATRQVRESIRQLLDDAPRERRLPALLHETVREVEGKYRVGIDWQAEAGAPAEASRETAEQIVNIARETLENACRHAHARAIGVRYGRQNGQGVLTITDDGCGFDPAAQAVQGNGHFGLRVMQARAAHIGGELRVESAPDAGTSVTLLFPAEEPRR